MVLFINIQSPRVKIQGFNRQPINPSHAAIKISINATAAEFICKNIFPTPVQVKKNIKNKIGDIQQIYLFRMFVNKFPAMLTNYHSPFH